MLTAKIGTALDRGNSVLGIASEFAQALMGDPEILRGELQGGGPLSRKRFCRFLSVGESTLTGWFQSDRIPTSAAVAYVLLLAAQELQKRVQELDQEKNEPKVISVGDRYAVARFESGDDGAIIGRVIASEIADLAAARQVAFSQSKKMLLLVNRQLELVEALIELTEQAGNDTPPRMADHDLERGELMRLKFLLTDFEQWTKFNKSQFSPQY